MLKECPKCGNRETCFEIYNGVPIVSCGMCEYRACAECAEKDAEIERLREALASIRLYSSDTLSGRIDGPEDREWFREGIQVVWGRAKTALEKG
jgi:uncharacterized Zn finger protein (UPF0148 family)